MTDAPKKLRWADMTDDDPIEVPVSRHGIKVAYIPPHLRTTKTEPTNKKPPPNENR